MSLNIHNDSHCDLKQYSKTIIAIGASTGGTEAILEVLHALPEDMPGIVITQHMPKGFTTLYAKRLNDHCNLSVKEASDFDDILPGRVLLAPGHMQMKVIKSPTGYKVRCYEGDLYNGHCPSVDVLFNSVATVVKEKKIGILLTGMGKDGAYGLLNMKQNGAFTIGQDKESCVVYGMPMVAKNIGATCIQAPCNKIGQILLEEVTR